MPALALQASLFDGYTLVFSADGFDSKTFEKTNGDLSTAITLPVGTWDLVITGYKLDGQTKVPLARGNVTGIAITAGGTASQSVELKPIANDGTGTFKWDITLPSSADIVNVSMTITPLDTWGSAEQTLWLADTGGTHTPTTDTSITLNAGIYRVALALYNGAITRTREEILHVYRNMESSYTENFADIFTVTLVTSEANSGAGSLRQALTDAPANSMICIADNVRTISLTSSDYSSSLSITKNVFIEGNSVVITQDGSLYSPLLTIGGVGTTVNISRVHFKGGNNIWGGAIRNYGILTLESCIFSGNQADNGGAIYNENSGTLTVKGCTFYNNSAYRYGGAINRYGSTTLTLIGNLFYGNTASSNPVVYPQVTSGGYNVVDVALGTRDDQAGWTAATGDVSIGIAISDLPISGKTYKLLSGSAAAHVITTLPAGYPTADFYGNPIPATGAAAGAVQASVSGSGYYVDLSVNNPAAGSVAVPSTPDADGLYSGSTALTATANSGYTFEYWLVNGDKQTANPLTITALALVQAVFAHPVTVTSAADSGDGTLRAALTGQQNGDKIILNLSGDKTITLASELPNITKSITIEGNGAIITQNGTNRLLRIASGSGTVNISRVHFKGSAGGAIYNDLVNFLTLESCIFSGNQAGSYGGAIMNFGTLTVKGCTFSNNTSSSVMGEAIFGNGGAIYNDIYGTLTLTGNLFFGNTAPSSPVTNNLGTITSGGYNVVDVAYGTSRDQAGWTAATGDITVNSPPIAANGKLLTNSGAKGVITPLPADYPVKDFYGDPITAPAAAGAVQSYYSGSGYYLIWSVNNSDRGSIATSAALPDTDGMYPAGTTLTATATSPYSLLYWLVNGSKQSANPLTITGHAQVQAVFAHVVNVTSAADSGDGSLREAITNAQDGDAIILNLTGDKTITLASALPDITTSITIDGNGAVITQTGSVTSSLLLTISNMVNISRVHFKGSAARAIINNGTLTLESCIFSDNPNGAISTEGTTLTVKGCTFYNNSAYWGGVISNAGGSLTLTGNLFYGNTASSYPVVLNSGGRTVTSGGYNVVDVAFGTESDQAGWTAATGDKTVSIPPILPATFKLLSGSGAANVITTLPAGYPTTDFYGDPINANVAAGAVQSSITESGYYAGWSVNDSRMGSAAVSPSPDANGLYAAGTTLTLTATRTGSYYIFKYWLVNGVQQTANPLTITITNHVSVKAVFVEGEYFSVIVPIPEWGWYSASTEALEGSNQFLLGTTLTAIPNSSCTFEYWLVNGVQQTANPITINERGTVQAIFAGSAIGDTVMVTSGDDDYYNPPSGSLRAAMNDGRYSTVRIASSVTTITLTSTLSVDKNIEGNGVVITQDGSLNDSLLNITYSEVNISRVHFKGGNTVVGSGRGGAITNMGTLTLESCIFSGNQGSNAGGAVRNGATLTVKGCTFYNNSGSSARGVIGQSYSSTLTLTGNLFYGNTAPSNPVVNNAGTITSGGYNVVDVAYGTATTEAGWEAATGDKTFSELGISGVPFDTTTFAPVAGLGSFIPSAPAGFPTTDFSGAARTWPGAAGAVK